MLLIITAIVIAALIAFALFKQDAKYEPKEDKSTIVVTNEHVWNPLQNPEPTPMPEEEPIIVPAPEVEKPKKEKKVVTKKAPKTTAVKKKAK